MDKRRIRTVQRRLLRWYQRSGRDLPWRRTRDPYRILISEMMLQQTPVARVIPKYRIWLKRFPNFESLARAPLRKVLAVWSGLGYNRRAVYLRRTARIVMRVHGGHLPASIEALQKLPGVGLYTAAAVAVFARRQSASMIDTNVRRVVRRVQYGWRSRVAEAALSQTAARLVPARQADRWHHAVMDLGATICTSQNPRCPACPLRVSCRSYPKILTASRPVRTSPTLKFTSTDRYWRGRIIALLTARSRMRRTSVARALVGLGRLAPVRLERLLRDLAAEDFLTVSREWVRLKS